MGNGIEVSTDYFNPGQAMTIRQRAMEQFAFITYKRSYLCLRLRNTW
jgi:hypothetical protein